MADGGLLQRAFEEIAGRVPDCPAWIGEDGTVTYGELNDAADRLAGHLHRQGIGSEDVVGLFLERGPDMAAAILGVLKAGAAYLPMGLDEPAARRARILIDARPRAVITHEPSRDRLTGEAVPAVPVIDLDTIDPEPYEGPAPHDPAAAAYLIYTSGSTGAPRGVVVEHRNLTGHVDWLRENLPLEPGDRLLQVAPYTFDASMTDFFWPLSCGAAVVSLAEGEHLDPLAIAETMTEREITAVRLPPVMLPLLLAEPVLREAMTLRYLICGGDRLPAVVARRAAEALPSARVFNRYGPTEAAVAATYHEFDPSADSAGDVPIGTPVGGARPYVDDGERISAPAPGLTGELLIGGAPVARGYLGDDALTAERFVTVPGTGRVFRTGDWVRVAASGALVFTGRRDEQVQVAGNRVELGEVRASLCEHPRVRDCAVVLRNPADPAVTAYVVEDQAGDGRLGESELRAFLLPRLPRHMVPGNVVYVERLPVTDRGKLDLGALPEPAAAAATEPEPGGEEPPLRRVWREYAGVADGARGFVESGGTSLAAAGLANRIRSTFHVAVTVGDILGAPSLDAFETWVGGLTSETLGVPPRRPDGAEPPLSHLQERLWFMHEFAPDQPVYNFQAIYHFSGGLDEEALRRALAGIVDRHEVLRTTFTSRDGVPRQVVHASARPALTVMDLREAGLSGDEAERTARRLADDFIRRSFEIDVLPLIRWCLIRLDDRTRWLVHSQHHLTHDGWSFSVFLHELVERYRAEATGTRPRLPEKYMQCGDFAYWQRRWWDEEGASEHLPYWTERLRGVPRLALSPRSRADDGQAGVQVRRRVTAEQVEAVARASAALEVTPFMFCMAAWNAFLWSLTGQQDFAVGTAVVNRPWAEAEHMLGCVLNNVPIRVRLDPETDFRTLVAETRRRLVEAYTHQSAPLHAIVKALGPTRSVENPIFQTTFNFHNAPFPDLSLPDVRMVLEEAVPNGTAKFPIDVVVITDAQMRTGGTGPGEWDMVWNSMERYFDAGQATAMADAFLEILVRVCADPGLRVGALGVTAADRPEAGETRQAPAPASAPSADDDTARMRSIIREVWSGLLKVDDLDDDDDFFERGGHSLLAVRAISMIRSRIGRRIPVRMIFEAQTVRTLADAVVAAVRPEGVPALPPA